MLNFYEVLYKMRVMGIFMKKLIIFVIVTMLVTLCSCSKAEPTLSTQQQNEPSSKVVKFNRLSLDIPEDWHYSTNPKAVPGTDQLQLYSKDNNRTLIITLTNAREDISINQAVTSWGKVLIGRVLGSPEFSDCLVEGEGSGSDLWGRKGTLVTFNLVKKSQDDKKNVAMKIYCLGEDLKETKEVLFTTATIVGDEKDDMINIVKSMKILEK